MLRSRYLFFRKYHGAVAAQTVTVLVRGALLLRAAKMLAETVAGRDAPGLSRPQTLWELTCSRQGSPAGLSARPGFSRCGERVQTRP